MQNDATKYMQYSAECRRLAIEMPKNKATLLEIADAWIRCAEMAERKPTNGEQTPDCGDRLIG
jgi:hypothetical protein